MLEQETAETPDRADDVHRTPQASDKTDDNDNGVIELESLCMNCHGDVRNCDNPTVYQL